MNVHGNHACSGTDRLIAKKGSMHAAAARCIFVITKITKQNIEDIPQIGSLHGASFTEIIIEK